MILLNLGAGDGCRPAPWLNVDAGGSDTPFPYVRHDLMQEWPPDFPREADGAVLSHCLEHFDLQEAAVLLWRCRELLRDGGFLRVSVPDAHHFFERRAADTPEYVQQHYDPGYGAEVGYTEYALFFEQHKMAYHEETLTLLLSVAGFPLDRIRRAPYAHSAFADRVAQELARADNRGNFSLFMEAQNDVSYPTEGQKRFAAYRRACLEGRQVNA